MEELQQAALALAEEPSIIKVNMESVEYSSHGTLHLTAENMSLVEEIKILIRKLWN